jgi:hypothetical protein
MTNAYVIPESNLNLSKKCLSLIKDIAERGAILQQSGERRLRLRKS